ncbi:MAG: ABC transporter substrate-binding protein, partial [Gemmatimonadales bacterium]
MACTMVFLHRSPPIPRLRMGGPIFSLYRRRSNPFHLLSAIIVGLGLIGCERGAPPKGELRAVDDARDTVRLQAPARRVVSLIPAATELLFAIGAGSSMVGRTQYCDYPPAAQAVANLGDGIKPSIEAVLAQRPDLVVLY